MLTTAYCGRTIEDWWASLRVKNAFPHPHGMEAAMKPASSKLPPILHDNEDLRRKFVRYCTQNVTDLNIDNAREYIINTLFPAAFELTIDSDTDNHQESRIDAMKRLYKVSDIPVNYLGVVNLLWV